MSAGSCGLWHKAVVAFAIGVVGLVAGRFSAPESLPGEIANAVEVQDPQDDPRLICIGALAGANVYITYGYIGTIADLYAMSGYDAEKTRGFLDEVRGLTAMASEQLKSIRQMNIIDTDRQAIDELMAINNLLIKEIDALAAYTKSDDKADAEEFEKIRTEVYPKIKALLGIE